MAAPVGILWHYACLKVIQDLPNYLLPFYILLPQRTGCSSGSTAAVLHEAPWLGEEGQGAASTAAAAAYCKSEEGIA